MKRILPLFTVMILLAACSGGSSRYRNPFLPDYSFSMNINTNLPTLSGLNSPINPIIIPDNGSGITIIAMKISDNDYRAWDAHCPNQVPSACSLMDIDGVNAVCSCENYEYSIFSGDGSQVEYTMKPYKVSVIGNNLLRISN
ncbi:Rieske (2Fe-2S) protein [Flavobacterium pallidum]|uniref:Rieske domain-containing protein n=1 Tax=Flavobacterium pallidum TaxID=2172098 RepID=A0A2S1SEL7_9FLAO|nr:hypothetical protein [Flavobacterium pallidum]AWI24853.1 hypothetical protein HYN49_02525 [Flavobacterium pallidum]